MKTFKMGGVHPEENKISTNAVIEQMPLPKQVAVLMNQHLGAPATPIVAKGDKVKVGQLIAEAQAFMCANIHSPVSGTVNKIDVCKDMVGLPKTAIYIDVEGDEWMETIDRTPDIKRECTLEPKEIVAKLKEMGIVGLGGATFPAHIKYSVPEGKKAEYLIINAAECEPYLSTDYREMIEHADTVLEGIATCLDLSGVPRSLICIEDNKPRAIELLRRLAADDPRIDVFELPARYPQGASRVILRNVTGRSVPRGGHLTDVGALLFNVTTMSEIGRFLRTGMPLTKRRLTVMGDAIAHPQNLEVYVGTPVREVLEYCGCAPGPRKVIVGGPMMGTTQVELDVPIVRQNCGLLAFGVEGPVIPPHTACIHCSRCIDSSTGRCG